MVLLNPGIRLFVPVFPDFFFVLLVGSKCGLACGLPLMGIGPEVLLISTGGRILAKNGGHADEALHLGAAEFATREGRVAHFLLNLKNMTVFLTLILVSGHASLLSGRT